MQLWKKMRILKKKIKLQWATEGRATGSHEVLWNLMGKVLYREAGRPARSTQHLLGRQENLSLVPRTGGAGRQQHNPSVHTWPSPLPCGSFCKRIVRNSSFPRKETKNPGRRHYFPILEKKHFLILHARGVTWKQNQNAPNANKKHQRPKRTQERKSSTCGNRWGTDSSERRENSSLSRSVRKSELVFVQHLSQPKALLFILWNKLSVQQNATLDYF